MLPIVREGLLIQQRRRRNRDLIRRRMEIRSRSNVFNLPDERFVELFRLNKNLVRNLIENVRPFLEERVSIKGVDIEIKICCALRFYATGSYQRCVGQDINLGLSQTTVQRCIQAVTRAIVNLAHNIKLPNSRLSEGNENSCLIGDSGYPLQRYLLTPFRVPETEAQRNYNFAHTRARNCVERCIGVLKQRFRCLLKERSARYGPRFMALIIKACVVLHNMCIDANLPFVEEFHDGNAIIQEPEDDHIHMEHPQGPALQARQHIVDLYF